MAPLSTPRGGACVAPFHAVRLSDFTHSGATPSWQLEIVRGVSTTFRGCLMRRESPIVKEAAPAVRDLVEGVTLVESSSGGGRTRGRTSHVVEQLRELIVRGDVTDGSFLGTEGELVKHFGLSRPSLGEALHRLEGEGLI